MTVTSYAIKCLLEKAKLGGANKISKESVEKVKSKIEELKAINDPNESVVKDLELAVKALKELTESYNQKVYGSTLHNIIAKKIENRMLESKAPAKWRMSTVVIADENTNLKYGYQGVAVNEAIEARTNYYGSMVNDLLEDIRPALLFSEGGPLSGKEKELEIVRQFFYVTRGIGKESSDPAVRKWVEKYIDFDTRASADYKRYGGMLKRRVDHFLGANHSIVEMQKMGKDKWVNLAYEVFDIQSLREMGIKEKDIKPFLYDVYSSIVNGGVVNYSKYVPKGLRSVATKRNYSRILNFRDADGWAKYHESMGGISLQENLTNHVKDIGRDVGILETLGPRPEAVFRKMVETVQRLDPENAKAIENTVRNQFNFVLGQWDTALNPKVEKLMGSTKALATAGSIGTGAAFDSVVGDAIGLNAMPRYLRGLPALKNMAQYFRYLFKNRKALNKELKEMARLGMSFEAFADETAYLFRTTDTQSASGWTQMLARLNYRVTLLGKSTTASKAASRVTVTDMMTSILDNDINDFLRSTLDSAGIGEKELAIYRKFPDPEAFDFSGNLKGIDIPGMFKAGYTEEAQKLSGLVMRSAELSSPTSNPRAAAQFAAIKRTGLAGQIVGGSVGTWQGYLASFWNSHFRVMWHLPHKAQRAMAIANLAIVLPAMYTLSQMVRDLLAGKEPALNTNTILKAYARSNIIPILGDYIFTAGMSHAGNITDRLAGYHLQLINSVLKAGYDLSRLEFGDAGQEILKATKSLVPFAAAWGTGLGLQRLIFDQLNELMRGPKARQQFRRAITKARNEGTPNWWRPGQALPDFLQ